VRSQAPSATAPEVCNFASPRKDETLAARNIRERSGPSGSNSPKMPLTDQRNAT